MRCAACFLLVDACVGNLNWCHRQGDKRRQRARKRHRVGVHSWQNLPGYDLGGYHIGSTNFLRMVGGHHCQKKTVNLRDDAMKMDG